MLILALLLCGPVAHALAACEVTLTWDASGGAAGYRLYTRQEGQSYSFGRPAWEGNGIQCTLSLNDNTPYYFVVRAIDAQGRESDNSNEVHFYSDSNPPAVPEMAGPQDGAQNTPLTPNLITGAYHDPDAGDYHAATQWQIFRSADDLAIFNLTTDFYLTSLMLPPLILDEATSYTWQVRHRNQHMAGSDPGSATFVTDVWAADEDADGIPDTQEVDGQTDLDKNGQDDNAQPKMKRLRSIRGDVIVAVNAGKSAPVVALSAVQAVDDGTLETPYPGSPELPLGLIGFKVITAHEGDVAEVTLHFSSPIPADYNWIAFSLSAGFEDYAHSSSLASDRGSVAVQVQDGGSGDLDGVANGVIVSIGGYGVLPTPSNLDGSAGSSGGGGGGGGCFIESLSLF